MLVVTRSTPAMAAEIPAGTAVHGCRSGRMVRMLSLLSVRMRTRLVLMMLVMVVASMTFHHGTMAVSAMDHQGAAVAVHHHGEGDTHERPGHSMPACCGIGLCLSGIPISLATVLMISIALPETMALVDVGPHWPHDRIYRPPKVVLS